MSKFNLKAKDHLSSSDDKRRYNLCHFTESAPRYDVATRMLSFGRDSAWKRKLIEVLPALENPFCVDIACGTGDVAFSLARKYPDGTILGADLTGAMIAIADKRNKFDNVSFETCDMCNLNIRASSVDILTGSYAIRNAPDLHLALKEIDRVLKPGAWAAFLDFSKPKNKILQKIQFALLKFWGSFCGLVLHANPEVHGYISASIKNFPDREQLQHMFEAAGFDVVKQKSLYLGMLEILLVQKQTELN